MEFIEKNVKLNELRTGIPMSTKAAASFTRNELAHALRKGPFQTDILVAGIDAEGPSLYFMDYLASSEKVNKAAHGYGAMFTLGLMDRYWKPNLEEAEAIEIIKMCIKELETHDILQGILFPLIRQGLMFLEEGFVMHAFLMGRLLWSLADDQGSFMGCSGLASHVHLMTWQKADAKEAMSSLNGKKVRGSVLTIDIAGPPPDPRNRPKEEGAGPARSAEKPAETPRRSGSRSRGRQRAGKGRDRSRSDRSRSRKSRRRNRGSR
ncbi:PBD2 [Symbiodinium sp. CCMP2592]|nr:PBD2 [Symbiodinium sp. CCMP2592]